MSSWRNPYQDETPTTPRRSRNVFRAPIVQSSPDPSPSRSRLSSHSPQLFQSASQLPLPPLTQLPSSEPQPSTSSLPLAPEPVQMDTDQQTGDNTAIQLLQQMQQMQ